MYVNEPKKLPTGLWLVEIVNYPESRSVEEYTFPTQNQAQSFYEANTKIEADIEEQKP